MNLIVIDWNISYDGDIRRKVEYLQTCFDENTFAMLQEVKPHAYDYIASVLSDNYKLLYSLDYRKPSKFDSDARKLGVLIILPKEIEILEVGVIDRSPFPDRTLYVTLKKDGKELRILALHSLTGCGYYRTKSVQYDSFAEFVDTYHPDIIGIDANEPQIDHYVIKEMEFFDNGPGARHFFEELVEIQMVDAYACAYDKASYVKGVPLTKSHMIRRKGAVRYDFLFVKDTANVESTDYRYDEAIAAGSDHAIIISEIAI